MTDHEQGQVRPLGPDGLPQDVGLIEPPGGRSNRGLIIGGVVLGVLVAGAIVAAVLWRVFVGSAFASAEAVPADADIVITFDLLQVRDSDRVDRLISAFTEPMAAEGLIDDGDVDVLDRIDEELDREIGMTLSDDVIPWIGRSVSVAWWFDGSPVSTEFDGDDVGGVLVAGVRNDGAAEAFVDKLARRVVRETGGTIDRSTRDGGEFVVVEVDDEFVDGLVAYRDSSLIILGLRARDVERALAARDGESMLDVAGYQDIIGELPSDRLVAMYMGTEWLSDVYQDPTLGLGAQADAISEQLDAFAGVAMSMTLRPEGVAFDVVYDVDPDAELPELGLDASESEFIDRLPDETLAMFLAPIEGQDIVDGIESLRDIDPFLYDDTLAQAEDFLGVDVMGDLLPALGREVVLAMFESPEGIIALESDLWIGAAFGIGVRDPGPVGDAIARLEDVAFDEGLDVRSLGSVSIVQNGNDPLFAYALSDDALVIGTGPTVVDALATGTDVTVADHPRYRQLDEGLPGDGVPLFVDLQGIFDAFRWTGSERSVFDPLQGIGAAGTVDGDLVRYSVLVLINY